MRTCLIDSQPSRHRGLTALFAASAAALAIASSRASAQAPDAPPSEPQVPAEPAPPAPAEPTPIAPAEPTPIAPAEPAPTAPLALPELDEPAAASEADDDGELDGGAPFPLRAVALLRPSLLDAPGAASRLTQRDLDQLRPYSLHDALRHIPGVNPIDDDGFSRRLNIGIRGGAPRRSRKVLLLEDGVSINASTYLDPSGHYAPPIERLQAVEVLRGAGQIIHGPLNNHGIVNFKNLEATLEPETVALAGYATNSGNRRHARHRRTLGDVGLVVAYTGADSDGVFDLERLGFDDIYASTAYRSGAHELGLSLVHYRERSRYDETNLTQAEFDAAPRCKSCLEGDRAGHELSNMAVDYNRAVAHHEVSVSRQVKLSSKAFVSRLFRPRFEPRSGGPFADEGSMRGRVRLYRQIGAETRLEVSSLLIGELRNDVQAGIRTEYHDFENRNVSGRFGELLDYDNRGSSRAIAGEDGYANSGVEEDYDALALSGFVQNAVSLGRWTLTPGLRIERYTQRKRTLFSEGDPIETPRETDVRLLALPGVSLHFRAHDGVAIYGGVHRGYAPAVARTEEYPLNPEIGWTSQVGARASAARFLLVEAAAFHSYLSDTLVKLSFTDERGNNIFINSGAARVLGFDTHARIDVGRPLESKYNPFITGSYTFTDARFTAEALDGNRLPEIPQHLIALTAGLEHDSGFDVSVTLTHRSAFYTDVQNTPVGSDDGEIGPVEDNTLLSARLNWRVPETPVTVFLAGTNLTDALYISDRADGIKPIQGRVVLTGITARLD